MNRREFLLWLSLTGLTSLQGLEFYEETKKQDIEKSIYNLEKYVHLAEYSGTYSGREVKVKGMGIFLDDYYISMAHIPYSLDSVRQRTSWGIIDIPRNVENKKAKVGDINLERLILETIGSNKGDIYIAKPDKFVVNFPCKPTRNFNYGDKVYLIGNPSLKGFNIRKGYVSDLDGYGNEYGKAEDSFGIDFPLQGGDSGCPVVNDKFELIGLAKYVARNKFGYVNKIGLYLDKIQEIKQTVTKPIYEKPKFISPRNNQNP